MHIPRSICAFAGSHLHVNRLLEMIMLRKITVGDAFSTFFYLEQFVCVYEVLNEWDNNVQLK